jgi:hypothetical protein
VDRTPDEIFTAEIEFDGAVSNDAGGMIVGRNATLRFDGGLTNDGSLALSIGTSDVFGDIDNNGSIAVSGGAAATFYDDVVQNGTLQVSEVDSTTSVAVFFGDFTGSGGSPGGADIFYEGDLQPGNSPALVTFENDIHFGVGTGLEIELGGLIAGKEHDKIDVDGDLELDGTLVVSLVNGFEPQAGNSFDILDWAGVSGTFDTLKLPTLSGLTWDISDLYRDGVLTVLSTGLAGDFDFDGDVDGRDFLIWQRGGSPSPLSPTDLADWQANYGSGSFVAANVAVPEPSSLLLVAGVGLFFLKRRIVNRVLKLIST